ncbi:MAG TPA: type II secretion system F family protein [Edaphobacter sp.]|nr:type II secretion system F family protein [Edaphobacter sp.]
MGVAALAFVVIFILIGSAGLLLFYREAMVERLSGLVTPGQKKASLLGLLQQRGISLGNNMMGQLERLVPRSQSELSVVQRRLVRAGYRNDTTMTFFYGAKILVPLCLCLIAFATPLSQGGLFVYALAVGLGFLAPDFWLGRKIATRQAKIRRGLPDVLDLMVICIEAGQSLDQATVRTAEELRAAHPAISDELGVVVLEQRAGRARTDAWRQFAERTAVDTVRNLVSVLVQSEKFGTSIAKTLRVHADTLRTQRRQKVEEQAAKTSVKLVFPLVLFIFPSLFVVTLGPACIVITESFKTFLTH